MATEKANSEFSDTHQESMEDHVTEQSPNSNFARRHQFGKALAHRALYGSSSRRGGSKKVRTSDMKALPSRLSKVSVADDDTQN